MGLDQLATGLDKNLRDLPGVFGNFAALQLWDVARVGHKPSPPTPLVRQGFLRVEELFKALCLHSSP